MGLFKLFSTFVLVVIILVVGVLGYAGAIPGVSILFGANKPRDLGIPHTAQDLVSGQAKLQQTFVHVTETVTVKSILNVGTSTVDTTLTASEWAAHVEAMHPVKDFQVKFHDDGTFEASGRIDKTRIVNAVKLLGYAKVSEAQVLDSVQKYLPRNAVFYMRGAGTIVNDQATVTLDRFEVGRLPLGKVMIAKALASYAKLSLINIPGFSLKFLEIKDGALHVKGTVPKQVPQF